MNRYLNDPLVIVFRKCLKIIIKISLFKIISLQEKTIHDLLALRADTFYVVRGERANDDCLAPPALLAATLCSSISEDAKIVADTVSLLREADGVLHCYHRTGGLKE